MTLRSRLETLEQRKSRNQGPVLFLGETGREADLWRGRSREWIRRPGESAENFKARVEREALPAGNRLLVAGFNPEPQTAA